MDQVNFGQAVKTVRGLQEVVNLSTKMLRSALGYPDDHGPSTLAILIQEICEDYAEKTALLGRVSAYLDKLEELNSQRKQDMAKMFTSVHKEFHLKEIINE